jgi:hypothetical protein
MHTQPLLVAATEVVRESGSVDNPCQHSPSRDGPALQWKMTLTSQTGIDQAQKEELANIDIQVVMCLKMWRREAKTAMSLTA